jgi:hypothetical protein
VSCISENGYRYDQRMSRHFKSFEEYQVALFILAGLLVFSGISAFIMISIGFMK